MDINERVLAAFQAEHKEHISGIRTLLDELPQEARRSDHPALDEAFRLAHTLKGGARVCDLRPAEELGHHLESLFASVRQGKLEWQPDVTQVVHQSLDLIEDWMAALADDQPPPSTDAALAAIGGLLGAPHARLKSAQSRIPESLAAELKAAFAEESAAHRDGLRRFLANQRVGVPVSAHDADEAFRQAHSLSSGARAAEMVDVAALAQELVRRLAEVRGGDRQFDEMVRNSWNSQLDCIEAAMRSLAGDEASPSSIANARSPWPRSGGARDLAASKGGGSGETVRVDAASLDRLIHCSSQLLSDLSTHEGLDSALGDLGRDLATMRRERENVRQLASASLQRLGAASPMGRVVNYLATIDRHFQWVSRRVDQLRRLQHRHQWQLRSRGGQIHEAVRQARMVPVESTLQAFRKMVRDLAREQGKRIDFHLRGLEHRIDRFVLQALKDPLMHVLRNAVVHGIEPPEERAAAAKAEMGAIELAIEATGKSLRIAVSDDGRGLNWKSVHDTAVQQGLLSERATEIDPDELIQLLFEPGFTTARDVSELAGRGMGLSVLQAAVARLKGEVRLQSHPGRGTRIELVIPLAVSTHRMLLIRAAAQTFAIPTNAVERLLRMAPTDMEILEGVPFITYQGTPIPLAAMTDLLGVHISERSTAAKAFDVVVVKAANQLAAVAVDALLAEREAMLHDLTGPAALAPGFTGAILLSNGDIALVIDPAAVARMAEHRSSLLAAPQAESTVNAEPPDVLIVDDSFTTRTLEKSILEAHGFRAHVAVDGENALSLLKSRRIDLVICDVEMPRMDGFQLLEHVRANERLKSLPFILVTSRDNFEDRENGLRLGADAYIVKQKFDHQVLLETIRGVL